MLRNGVVVYAEGQLDLGRTTRLASRAQRRAMRALYPTCAVPGCGTPFQHTKLHHIDYWEHGGRTDFSNLLPLCVKHHHKVHDDGWRLHLHPDRTLTVTLPDETVLTTRPPENEPPPDTTGGRRKPDPRRSQTRTAGEDTERSVRARTRTPRSYGWTAGPARRRPTFRASLVDESDKAS